MSEIYPRFKDIREDNDLTQKQLAESIGLYTTTYRRYECGESMMPLDIATELAKKFNISLDYLVGLTNEPRKLY